MSERDPETGILLFWLLALFTVAVVCVLVIGGQRLMRLEARVDSLYATEHQPKEPKP